MKIGIYKPFKKVFFKDDSEDTAAWSYEVVNVAKIFAERGHEIKILSNTDLLDFEIENISNGTFFETYDRIITFSGLFHRDSDDNIIKTLRALTKRLDFLLTDLRLLPKDEDLKLFDNIYTQATKKLERIGGKYGGVAEFICYKAKFADKNVKKDIKYYFGGTERGRLKDFAEYVWRPDCTITGKSSTLDFDTRVDRKTYLKNLDRAKYSIVIADEEYNENYFITPRHYENILHNIISFVDTKFDKDEHLIRMSDWRRVNNYLEMLEKIKYLEEHQEEYQKILKQQQEEIKAEFISGDYVYNLLK